MKTKNRKGFSIIELSISLTIVGIVILFTMSSLQAIGENVAATKTETKIDSLTTSIINNVTSATSGTSLGSSGMRDLRLPSKDDMKALFSEIDGYGNTFDYIPGDILLDSHSGTNLCTATQTGLQFQFKDFGESGYREMPQIAFIIVGKGSNLKKDYDDSSSNIIKLDRSNKADDVFRYVTLDELKLKVGCSVGRNEDFKILTTEIPPLQPNAIGRIFATKPSNFPPSAATFWCLQTPKREAVQKAIFINLSSTDDFYYPVLDITTWGLQVLNSSCAAKIEVGDSVVMSRSKNAIPGTYKLKAVASYGKSSILGRDEKTFVVTVPFQ